MRSARSRVGAAVLFTACMVAGVTACSSSASGPSASGGTKTLNVWLGGSYAFATPGSTTLTMVKDLVSAFEAAHPGVKVTYSLLPADNAAMIAKLDSAFTSGSVPDVIANFPGSFTTAFASQLMPLNKYVTPAFYNSLNSWQMSCLNYSCDGGHAPIYGVPSDTYAYLLYYNKGLFAKAGIASPPTTYAQLYSDCKALKGKGIIPFADGDGSGYTTSNLFDEGIASYFTPAQINALAKGKISWTDSSIVNTFSAIAEIHKLGCVPSNASTTEQTNGVNNFTIGKAAMVEMYPQLVPTFQKSLGSNLGVAALPSVNVAAKYPSIAAGAADNWSIPKGASDPQLAWQFISMAVNYHFGLLEQELLGYPSANNQALAHLTDPYVEAGAKLAEQAKDPFLDITLPNSLSLDLYKESQLIFAGLATPQGGAAALQQEAASLSSGS
jgi:ABC-type glycerol-3-phosphate transport system substrate-binding protein